LKRGQTLPRTDAIAGGNPGEFPLILRQLRSISCSVPKVEHAGRERPILAAEAGMQQANDDVGIFLAPSAVVRIEAVNVIEI